MPLKRKAGLYEKLLGEGAVEDKTGCKENICEKYVLTGETQEILLPINAKLWVTMGLVKKKELLRVEVSSPHYRHELSLPLVNNEVLVSEIYMLSSTFTSEVKKMIRLYIPFSNVNIKRYMIKAYTRQSRDHIWDEIDCSIKVIDDKELLGEILLDNFGHFILTRFPKYDPFNLIPSGCIFYARLSRYVSIRCPRFTVETPVGCNLQIIPILRTTLEYCQEQYSTRCEELLECSEMVVLSSEYNNVFRRPLTLKLPLPELLDTTLEETLDDIGVVARKPDDKQWYLIENQYQFTRNSVSVDTTHLGMFAVGRSAPGKKKKIKESVQILEEKLDVFLGTITMFIRFQEDQWVVVIACHNHSNIEQLEEKWKERNFIRITADVADDIKYQTLAASEKYAHFQGNKCIELKNNQSWAISVFGNLKVSDEEQEYNQLVYHEGLKENYKVFNIQPAHEEVTHLIGMIEISPEHIDSSDFWKLSAVFQVEVPTTIVKNYWTLKQEEKAKELKMLALQEQQLRKQQQLEQQQQEQLQRQLQRQQWEQYKQKQQLEMSEILKMPTPESINNLSRPVRVQEVDRQRNVLTGRSLMAMSELIHDPIALATFLKLPNATIQAIGFDSIAINYSAKAKSYRVLLHWKRFFCPKGSTAVEDLVNAFKEINLDALAEAVKYHDSLNREMNIQSIKLCMESKSGWK